MQVIKRKWKREWETANPILPDGEPGLEIDSNRIKVGDGQRRWKDLNFVSTSLPTYLGEDAVKAGSVAAAKDAINKGDIVVGLTAQQIIADAAVKAANLATAQRAIHPRFGTSMPVTIQGLNNGDGVVANAQAGGQSQRVPYKAAVDCTDIRLVFTMFSATFGTPSAPDGPVTFKAAIEYNGVTYPVTFDGKRTVVADPWSMPIGDAVGLELAAGETFYVRTWFNTNANGTYPAVLNLNGSAGLGLSGSWTNGSDVCDAVGPMGGAQAGAAWVVFSPSQVLGTPLGARKPVATFIGDSHALGIGDQKVGGYIFRALANTPLPANVISMPGGTLATLVGKQGHVRVGPFLNLGDNPFCMMGTNDLDPGTAGRTAVQLEQDMLTLGQMLINRGVKNKLTVGTLIPRTTNAGSTAAHTSQPQRIVFNAWVRAGCPMDPATGLRVNPGTAGAIVAGHANHPIKGYVEIADSVETARDSGLFKAGFTSEGTHLSTAGAQAAQVPLQTWLASLT